MAKDEIVYSFSLGDTPKKYNPDAQDENKKYKSSDDSYIRISLEKNKRHGKTVTIIYSFKENENIEHLCAELKKKCGSGGTVKNGHIEIQGDKRDIIEKYLTDKGYKIKRSGG